MAAIALSTPFNVLSANMFTRGQTGAIPTTPNPLIATRCWSGESWAMSGGIVVVAGCQGAGAVVVGVVVDVFVVVPVGVVLVGVLVVDGVVLVVFVDVLGVDVLVPVLVDPVFGVDGVELPVPELVDVFVLVLVFGVVVFVGTGAGACDLL